MKIRISPPAILLALFALLSLGVLAPSARATTYQADTTPPATYSDAGRVQSTNSGWTGTGYYNYVASSTSWIEFAVNTANTGSHTLTFRYANALSPVADMPLAITVDGISVGTVPCASTSSSGNWSIWTDQTKTVSLTPGNHTVRATSTNSNGGPNIDKLDLTGGIPPGNVPPTVSLTSPANGATFTAPASITLNATAADSDGTVSKVDFYQGTTLLGTDTTSPYSFVWSNVAAASYALTAKATDNSAAVTTSSPAVNITVNTAGGTDPGQVGWSTLNGGTTGGKFGGSTVLVDNVDTFAELKAACESTTAQTIRITGNITSTTNDGTGRIVIKSNKSIIGDTPTGPLLQGIGLQIIGGTTNIIIRNLKMTLSNLATPTATNSGDNIQIYGTGGSIRNIWIDHCEFFSEPLVLNPATGKYDLLPDSQKYDGQIDPTLDVSYITISWCYFHDHYKSCLLGENPSDTTNRRATLHHNRYASVVERTPSQRFGEGHVYNNYFDHVGKTVAPLTGSTVHTRMGAILRIEGNVFEFCNNPVQNTASGETDGYYVIGAGIYANEYTNCSVGPRGLMPTTSSPGKSLTPPYSYQLDATSTVKATVTGPNGAGAGKIAIPIP